MKILILTITLVPILYSCVNDVTLEQVASSSEGETSETPAIEAQKKVVAGRRVTCILFKDLMKVKCFGEQSAVLGTQASEDLGDDEDISSIPYIDLGGDAIDIELGRNHACALLSGNKLRCWGSNSYGQLGYGNTTVIGDDENPSSAGDVNFGSGTITQMALGTYHTCLLFDDGQVKCWGKADYGELGYGNTTDIGDDELPSSVGNLSLGGSAKSIHAAEDSTCAVLSSGNQYICWGADNWGEHGNPGFTWDFVGDDEVPSTAGAVTLAKDIKSLSVGYYHLCIVFDDDSIKCSGYGNSGMLGYANTSDIYDITVAADVSIGTNKPIKSIHTSNSYTCILYEDSNVHCWGYSQNLGTDASSNVGDDENPSSSTQFNFSGNAFTLSSTYNHSCLYLENEDIYCWGSNSWGELGVQKSSLPVPNWVDYYLDSLSITL